MQVIYKINTYNMNRTIQVGCNEMFKTFYKRN